MANIQSLLKVCKPTTSTFSVFLVIIISILTLQFCSLERNNPLDPSGNSDIIVPNEIINISLEVSPRNISPRWIKISWRKDDLVDGYYLYRSMSQHSYFMRIAKIENNQINEYVDKDGVLSGREYWYRISAYIDYGEQGILEGKLSPITNKNAVWVN